MTDEYLSEVRTLLLDKEEMEKKGFFIDQVPQKSIDNRLLKKQQKCRYCFQGMSQLNLAVPLPLSGKSILTGHHRMRAKSPWQYKTAGQSLPGS